MEKWDEVKKDIKSLSKAENLEIEIMAELNSIVRNTGYSERELDEITGLKNSAINRMLNMKVSSTLSSICKLLSPLGYTLKIVKKDDK